MSNSRSVADVLGTTSSAISLMINRDRLAAKCQSATYLVARLQGVYQCVTFEPLEIGMASTSEIVSLRDEIRELRRAVDLMWTDIDFIRTHSSSYLGNQIAMTHLVDETPMYINSNDFGGPSNFINGGRYEEENLAVLLSFVKDDSVFLDIGANLGFFSLLVGRRVSRSGRVHSFEPHPQLGELLKRSAFLNGLSNTITLHPHGLSDKNAPIEFGYPVGHLGGGSVVSGPAENRIIVKSEVRRLDDVMGEGFSCDLMKIDVEGHELFVFRGMKRILSNSPNLKILFEKLAVSAGYEDEIVDFLGQFGFALYRVASDCSLVRLEPADVRSFSGYVLAARPETIGDPFRNRFSIYPGQLSFPQGGERRGQAQVASGGPGQVIIHGPYWYLRRGHWKLKLHGANEGGVHVTIAARFGHPIAEFMLPAGYTEGEFIAHRDLQAFECVFRPLSDSTKITVESIELVRLG